MKKAPAVAASSRPLASSTTTPPAETTAIWICIIAFAVASVVRGVAIYDSDYWGGEWHEWLLLPVQAVMRTGVMALYYFQVSFFAVAWGVCFLGALGSLLFSADAWFLLVFVVGSFVLVLVLSAL